MLLIPDDEQWLALVSGALSELTNAYNFEQFGTATPVETAERFLQMFSEYEDCVPDVYSYIQVEERQNQGTAGGGFTAGAWTKRSINTEIHDSDDLISLSSGVMTIQPGTYTFECYAVAFAVGLNKVRLRNTSDSIDYQGIALDANAGASACETAARVVGKFTIAAAKNFELQHFCATTQNTNGLGKPTSQGAEVYAVARFWKEPT